MQQEAPPKNLLMLTIRHRHGVLEVDPNQFAAMSLVPKVIGALMHPLPDEKSDLSGEHRAVVFRDGELELRLTVEELLDLGGLRLQPAQFRTLQTNFGPNFWWHDDYYDQDTGTALQPRSHFQ